MAVVPERARTDLRGRTSPVRLHPGRPRLGFRRWYRRARAEGWSVRDAIVGAWRFG